MTEKYAITLLFAGNILMGVRLIGNVPHESIQFFKNDKLKAEFPISFLKKKDLQLFLFPDCYISYDKDDKIGIKLI